MKLTDKLASERRARLAAERLLDLKSRELFEANRKLSKHALKLSDQIVEQREEVRVVRNEAEQLKDRAAQTQEELARAEEMVETAERRLWDSVETIADGFAVFDQQDRLIAANSAWLALFDYSETIQPGIPYLEVLRLATDEGFVDTGDSSPSDWIGEMLDRWDGPEIPEVTIRLWNGQYCRMLDRRSRDGDMVCLALDITSMIAREEELREARTRAEAASRAKSAFLANMSHELRTPMNGVVAMTELLLESELDEEQRLYLRTIRSSGEALLSIINDVLDFSRLEAEHVTLRPEPFDMERMLHEVLTLVAPMARDKGLDLHVDYDLFLPTTLVGDPGRIRQVLTNLIGNAVKFTEKGYVLVRLVGMEAEENSWQIHVTVEDTGIGIEPEMQEHIFASFAQVEEDKNRSFEGTGLGLAISREIVTRMGGDIWVESEKGKGSCFGFGVTLPGTEPRRPAPRGLEPGQVRAMMVGSGDDLDQVILTKQLRQLGLQVRQAGGGSDALAALRTEAPPQIVMIDEHLPDTTGTDLAAALRRAGLHTATVLLCADPHNAAAPAVQAAVDATLVRPILRSQLFRTLSTLAATATNPAAPLKASIPSCKEDTSEAPPSEQAMETGVPAVTFSSRRRVPTRSGPAPEQPSPGVTRPSGAQSTSAPLEPGPSATRVDQPRMRVLAAEDNRTNQFVFQKIIKELDIDLAFASNGQEAIDLFGSFAPDLVFMDISMPIVDGKEATRRIRETERPERRIPIIALTANALSEDREEIIASGLDDYLTKPLRKDPIIEMITSHCPPGRRPPVNPLPTAAE
ncbi:response regulator [Tropicimonas marinistellae]|uniref:response regulator n=1 Tax=Tropicimonas marinistellae TaxID=1739787 RepID=UPI000834717C|nr:response regulator [Tropicimonas marinistellae]